MLGCDVFSKLVGDEMFTDQIFVQWRSHLPSVREF